LDAVKRVGIAPKGLAANSELTLVAVFSGENLG